MKLRAEIRIDVDAEDFVEAADHQRAFQTLFGQVKQHYEQASLSLRELRGQPASAASRRRRYRPEESALIGKRG